jgi:mannose-6-phosphate isomerase
VSIPPIPVVFEPIFKPKPWGGRRLESLFNKPLPPGQLIGESWELVSLPGEESRVRNGPLDGQTVTELMNAWGADLYGAAKLAHGRFPLLIKFLDARENLSVQVHPKPATDVASDSQVGVKHEAWYVLHADPGAELFVGLNPGVTTDDLARTANSPGIVDLLRRWPAKAGQWFYLPSGVVHALGAGIVVAEVQTPSDVTYRLYDWERVDSAGRPRELHIEPALHNVLMNVPDQTILQPLGGPASCRPTGCPQIGYSGFHACRLQEPAELDRALLGTEMAIWIVLSGRGALAKDRFRCNFAPGDVVLIPADRQGLRASIAAPFELLAISPPMAGGGRSEPPAGP